MDTGPLFKTHVLKHKGAYIIGVALLSISCLMQLVIPKVLERYTNQLQEYGLAAADILQFAIWIVVIALGVAFFRAVSRIYIFKLSRTLEKQVRNRLFKKWEGLSASYYNKHRIGDLMSHAVNDLNVIREVGFHGVFFSVEAIVMISVTMIAMGVTVSLPLTLLVLLPLPALTYIAYKFRFEIQTRATRVQEAISHITSRVQEFAAGIRIVKTYVQEQEEIRKFTEDNLNNVDAQRKLIQSNSMFTSLSQGIVGISYMISVVFGGYLVLTNRITLGGFVAFNTYLTMLIQPVENLGRVINVLQRGAAADIRLRNVLNTEPDVKNEESVLPIKKIRGHIRVQNLTFTYPGSKQPVLKEIELDVPAGSSLAIVGKVGSGKTTLMQLLLRMYNPPKGTIFVDGNDLFQIPLETLRSHIGYVPQEHFLFSTSIKENIAFDPQKRYKDKEIHQASKMAQVYDNIVEFPYQFDTELGEKGMSLSGGQRQRVSIARALIKKPSILIFDDSLSAVDTETESLILAELKKEMKNRTSIIISHRISTIQHADQIIVMDEGRIIERGDHAELVKQGGVYAKMYYHQLMNQGLEEGVGE